ncbi:MAG: DNA primase [Candidatus Bipolaricaulaceae bacterium]
MGRPDVGEVKSRVNILELIGRYVQLKPAGKNHKGRCPFHPDDTPSLTVSPDKGLWHCFGCGAGGDAIGFLMRIERLTFPEALERLAQEVGVELAGGGERSGLYRACAAAADYFSRQLRAPPGRPARDHLLERGIGEDLWGRFGLGYAPDRWDGVRKALAEFGVETLVQLGLLIPGDRGPYDRFRGRLMFTLRDDQGRPVAFAGRALTDQGPKYLNVPNTPLFTKGTLLYGLDLAKEAVRRQGRAVLVEGYTDVISLHRAGVAEAVGSMGTALTEAQARLLARHCERAIIAYDRDAAGSAAALRGMVLLREVGLQVHVAQLPLGEDPDSLVRGRGAAAAAQALEQAPPFHQFFLQALAERHPLDTLAGKEAALAEAGELWPKVSSLPLRQELARGLAELLDLPEEEVRAALRGRPQADVRQEEAGKALGAQEILLYFLLAGELPEAPIADLEIQDFRPEYQPIVDRWLKLWRAGGPSTPDAVAQDLDPQSQAQVARLALLDVQFSDRERAREDAVVRCLYLPKLERQLAEVKGRLARAEADGDGPALRKLHAEYQTLCRRRLELLRRRP